MAEIVRQQLTAVPPVVPAQSYVPPRPQPRQPSLRMNTDPTVWRVREPELNELMGWLGPKLLERYPRATASTIVAMLQGAVITPSMYLVRTKNTVLLVETHTSGLEPLPIATETFLRIRANQADPSDVRKAQYEEGLLCYRAAIAWCESIRVARMDIGFDTDLPLASLYDADNGAKKRAFYGVPISPRAR